MRYTRMLHTTIMYFIALVWLVNGLVCKVLHLVPRHELIVASVLGSTHSSLLTVIIGSSEIGMAAWILSSLQPRLCAIVQIVIVGAMNIIEYNKALDLLLFGKANLLFAALFIVVIYLNAFRLNRKYTATRFSCLHP
ncbi:MAG: DoxX-like family protein [Chitinophagaceae bacterium]